MKIGILGHDFISWVGGVDFLRQVIDSLLATDRARASEFHLLLPDSGPRLAWRNLRHGAKRTVRALFSGKAAAASHAPATALVCDSFAEFSSRIEIHHMDTGRRALVGAVKRLGLDVVLPAVHSLRDDFPCPWVAYVYDFQHKYFPENFSPDDARARDDHFAGLLTEARAAIVNSRAAAVDIAKFVPQAKARIFALPFAPAPGRDWLDEFPEVPARYGVTAPFFIISNQFWVHKDHATAFAAFRMVAEKNPGVSLVCTGSTVDARHPEYFPGLLARLRNWNLEERVRILGLIPKRDQIELMKNACAVVQPTLFEGGPGGGAVYDALSLGVPSIVTDLPVCREIESANVVYFPPGDAAALAGAMQAALDARAPRPQAAELLALGRQRRAVCGQSLWEAIDLVTGAKGLPR